MIRENESVDTIELSRDRRLFLKTVTLGAAGLVCGMTQTDTVHGALRSNGSKSSVSFVTGNDRRDMVYQALKPFEKEIKEGIKGKQVVIKSNLVDPLNDLAATHPDAVRGVLDFLKPIYKKRIIVGDSTGRPGGTVECLKNHNYYQLEKEYNVKCVDFNENSTSILWILGQDIHPLDIEIIDTFLDPDNYIISLTRPKTHNGVVVTLSIKNIIMGSPVNVITRKNRLFRGQKTKMHNAGTKGLNFNIFQLAQRIQPRLAIIDGLVGMEGNGPTDGTPVEHGFALAGLDMVAVDRVTSHLMGVNIDDIGYLSYLSWAGVGQTDLSKINIIGPDIASFVIPYKMHDNIENQLTWKEGLVIDKM
ncbi:MAG: DUF362 domain-containing protein [Candidatus Latescibacteria bacterium]|nr:DUF362 domain-containing protein [Candidatus Latescibacterota bacterium]